MKRILTLAGIGLLGLGTLAACSPSATNFKSDGEKYIEEDDGDVARGLGHTFDNANCAKPADTDVGTAYRCTADDDEGDSWNFTIEITGKRELTVNSAFHPKLVHSDIVDTLSGSGTLDEACIDGLIAAIPAADLEEALVDYLTSESPDEDSEALLNELYSGAEATCVS